MKTFVRLSVQMRTTFSEICLFNADFFQHETSFIFNGKEWGIGSGGERMRENKREQERMRENEREQERARENKRE
jgi:hypothetical protein